MTVKAAAAGLLDIIKPAGVHDLSQYSGWGALAPGVEQGRSPRSSDSGAFGDEGGRCFRTEVTSDSTYRMY